MMKYLLALCFFLSYYASAQLDSLKGPVRSVKQTVEWCSQGLTLYHRETFFATGLDQESIFWEFNWRQFPNMPEDFEKMFDQKGRMVELSTHLRSYSMSFTRCYEYDVMGNEILERRESRSPTSFSWEERRRTYIIRPDSIRLLALEVSYNNDPGWMKVIEYLYDSLLQLREKRELHARGSAFHYNYEYDDEGRLLMEKVYAKGEKLIPDTVYGGHKFIDTLELRNKDTYSYNPDGTLKESTWGCSPSADIPFCWITAYEYDTKKNKSKVLYHKNGKVHSWKNYEYNPDNTIRKITRYRSGYESNPNEVEYTYENKELVKAILKENGTTYIFDFEYLVDAYGNWTQQKKYLNSNLVYIRNREISYW